MLKNRSVLIYFLALTGIILEGCQGYEKLLKSRDFQKKYEVGLQYYEEGDYVRAGALFDQTANIFRGTISKILSGNELLRST
jgi:outer membrane protein assembly factor BamD